MPMTAFILTAPSGIAPALGTSSLISSTRVLRATPRRFYPCRARIQANAETDEKSPAAETVEATETEVPSSELPIGAPSFDTEVFSNFVESAQAKVDEFTEQMQDVDTSALLDDTKEATIGLIDNLLAGDWLNRGELYGAIQLVFVILLLRGPGALDGLVSFLCGPLILIAGAVISGKSLWDLGRKQLSIWPAPVPNGELQVDGMYGIVRHPMYSGLILASAGFAVSTGSPARMALTIAFAAFLAKKVEVEEDFLKDTYSDYGEYCEKVKNKILPGIF